MVGHGVEQQGERDDGVLSRDRDLSFILSVYDMDQLQGPHLSSPFALTAATVCNADNSRDILGKGMLATEPGDVLARTSTPVRAKPWVRVIRYPNTSAIDESLLGEIRNSHQKKAIFAISRFSTCCALTSTTTLQ